MTATKDAFFKPGRASATAKAQLTDTVVKTILSEETAARESKTERLRSLRLAQPATEAPKKKKK